MKKFATIAIIGLLAMSTLTGCNISVNGKTVLEASDEDVEKLKETENSILEIATDCGFSSPTYFNRVFKSFFGCSPSVYRKLSSKNIIN